MKFELNLDGGKYTYRFDNGKQDALRYGEPWRDLTGDNLTFCLAVDLHRYREACSGLAIPEACPPGILADAVAALRECETELSHAATNPGDYRPGPQNRAIQAARRILAALTPAAVSPPVTMVSPPGVRKTYHVHTNVGKARHVVSFHDGVKTHPDGSPFFDMEISKNKGDQDSFIQKLQSEGYTES